MKLPPDKRILAELRIILAQHKDCDQTAKRIVDAIRLAGRYRWVGIYDVDIRRGLVSNVAWSGPAAPAFPTFAITNGLTSRAVATKKTINVGDVARDSDYLTALGSTRSEIIVPVLRQAGEHVVGTIDLESDQPNAFDPAIQALLEECATTLQPFWSENP